MAAQPPRPHYPAACEYLIRDARIETDGTFLLGAIKNRSNGKPVVPGSLMEPCMAVARQLLASRLPDTRADGYGIAAAIGSGQGIATRVLVKGVQERGINALNAALNLVEITLRHDPDRWRDESSFSALEAALESLVRPGAAPVPTQTDRARTCLWLLYCHCGALGTPRQRRRTIDRVRTLILTSGSPEALAPLGHLMTRLAATDPIAAGDLLIEASMAVHTRTLEDTTNSWKGRRARRWRAAITDVVVTLPYSAWRRVIDRLAHQDPDILIQAVDTSVRERTEDVEAYIRRVYDRTGQDDRVEAYFRTAISRKQRIQGGTSTWPELLDAWRRRQLAVAGSETSTFLAQIGLPTQPSPSV